MFENSAFWNKRFKRPFYRAFFLDNFHYLGETVVTVNGKEDLKFGKRAYTRPIDDKSKILISKYEWWIFYDKDFFMPLTTNKDKWIKSSNSPPYIMMRNEKTGELEQQPLKFYEQFDSGVVQSYSESHTGSEILKPKEDKFDKVIVPIIILAVVVIAFVFVYVIMKGMGVIH